MTLKTLPLLLLVLLPLAPTPLLSSVDDRVRVMAAVIADDSTDASVTATKIEAGLSLAMDLTERYLYLPTVVRDSLVRERTAEPVTTLQAVSITGAQMAIFARCIRIANLVRAEIALRSGTDLETERIGVGYAAIQHVRDSVVVADPAILASLQRALCDALSDPQLFDGAPTELRVRPSTLLGIGGIEFQNAADLPLWSIFEDRTVVSYDLAINLVHALHERPSLTVIDLDTRDSMYALGGLYLVENDRPVSNSELRILRLFDVQTVVTGSLTRDEQGAMLRLHWCRIEPDGRYTVQKSASRRITSDALIDLIEAVLECASELGPREP